MEKTYTKTVHETGLVSIASSDGWVFGEDPANSDYQAYLAWLAEGNEPEMLD